MREDVNGSSQTTAGELCLNELLPAMATCGGADPGPDPTWDPDELPPELHELPEDDTDRRAS